MKKAIAIILISVVVGCAAVKIIQPSAADLEKMKSKVPDITYENAIAGYNLYNAKCNRCHGLHRPGEFTKIQWEKILPEMLRDAKIFDADEKKILTDYLVANSK
jgi:cytochrome c5